MGQKLLKKKPDQSVNLGAKVENAVLALSRRTALRVAIGGLTGLVFYRAFTPKLVNRGNAAYRPDLDFFDDQIPTYEQLATYKRPGYGAAANNTSGLESELIEYADEESAIQDGDLNLTDLLDPSDVPLPTKPKAIDLFADLKPPKEKPSQYIEKQFAKLEQNPIATLANIVSPPQAKPSIINRIAQPAPTQRTATRTTAHSTSGGTKRLRILNKHTNDYEDLVYASGGSYRDKALQRLNYVFRDWRTGDIRQIDPRLFDQLHYILTRAGDSQTVIHMVSGYRSRSTNNMLRQSSRGVASNSYHIRGQAVDFSLSNQSIQETHRVAAINSAGGVGYYPSSNFIHIDTGPLRDWPRKYRARVERYRRQA